MEARTFFDFLSRAWFYRDRLALRGPLWYGDVMSDTNNTTVDPDAERREARIAAAKKRVEANKATDAARREQERADARARAEAREKEAAIEVPEIAEPEDLLPPGAGVTVDVAPTDIADVVGGAVGGLEVVGDNVIRGAAADWLRTPIGFQVTEPRFPAGRNATIGILEDNATRAFIAGVRWREGRGS